MHVGAHVCVAGWRVGVRPREDKAFAAQGQSGTRVREGVRERRKPNKRDVSRQRVAGKFAGISRSGASSCVYSASHARALDGCCGPSAAGGRGRLVTSFFPPLSPRSAATFSCECFMQTIRRYAVILRRAKEIPSLLTFYLRRPSYVRPRSCLSRSLDFSAPAKS
jgi:hypothetical protein